MVVVNYCDTSSRRSVEISSTFWLGTTRYSTRPYYGVWVSLTLFGQLVKSNGLRLVCPLNQRKSSTPGIHSLVMIKIKKMR